MILWGLFQRPKARLTKLDGLNVEFSENNIHLKWFFSIFFHTPNLSRTQQLSSGNTD